ncbi:CHAT domain protein [Rubripirellula lacrimiformis]|uniref:CHAT domain protein n=2 Tax=Rubripirellula lacrimiformis TaxID=1930273 RepID=A0A517NIM4_9BACT|nr:CHAT domain protein [Rubripirellula lacrimiformis]
MMSTPDTARGQGGGLGNFGALGGVELTGQYPPQSYYLALQVYRSGDLPNAVDAFEAALRGSRRDVNGRMIDAIPALAMLGECYWHLGNVPASRDYTDQVFNIAIRYHGWIGRVDWGTSVQANVQRTKPNWLWPEAAAVNLIPTSQRIMFTSGKQLTEADLVAGGRIEELNLRPMDIVEIMRGVAVASHRRRIIMGPLADDDAVAATLVDAIKFPRDLNIPVARSLIGSMRTAGYFAKHNEKSVLSEANRSAVVGGVHPLSAIALQCQASTMAASSQPDAVIAIAANVANAAAVTEQPEWIGEAMQLAAGCASADRAAGVAKMATVAAGALSRQSRLGTLHCLIAAADAAVTAGSIDDASGLLSQASGLLSRRDVIQPRLEAYGAYVAARIAAARGASFGGNQSGDLELSLAKIESFALNHRDRKQILISMPRIYQLGLIRQAIGNSVGGTTGSQWLEAYSDEPTIDVWRRDAVDALAGVIVDRSASHQARINLAAVGGYAEELLLACDSMLAARFVDRLPIGGRIARARAIAGNDDLDQAADVAEIRAAAGPLMAELRAGALIGGDPNPQMVETLESKALSVALSRVRLPQMVVPQLDAKLPIAKLPPRTGLVTFTSVGNRLYGTLSGDGETVMWNVAGSSRLSGEIGRLLMGIGVGKSRGKRLPEDDAWKKAALSIRDRLFPDNTLVTADRFDHLILVLDGPLWYLPMELFPSEAEDSPMWADTFQIRYAPTPGMGMKPSAMPPSSRVVGITSDKFFAPRDKDLNESIFESVIESAAESIRLPESLSVPTALLGERVGHLVVASANPANLKAPLAMSLASYDSSSPYSTTAAWLRFPLAAPRSVVLFGMRTSVDVGKMGTGDEIFMTLCGLHAAGVRSVLLSRWAVGGESSAALLREFLQELPFTGMNHAWGRSRELLRQRELDPTGEPLLMQAEHDREGVTGDQPLFWSGYLISSPPMPKAAEAPTAPSTENQPAGNQRVGNGAAEMPAADAAIPDAAIPDAAMPDAAIPDAAAMEDPAAPVAEAIQPDAP